MKYTFLTILSLLFATGSLQSQSWWNETHNWDGFTHWSKYLEVSPGYFGPNALPVPDVRDGLLSNRYRFDLAAEYHHSPGDKTQNLFTQLYIPLAKDKVGFNISLVPIERFSFDMETRDLRAARDEDGMGYAGGDFYVSTFIQLLKDHSKLSDLLLTVNLKTASGTNLEAVRFTDTPGYFFDLSFGKQINKLRFYGMMGFYVWQTYEDLSPQNDAFLFGAGIRYQLSKLNFDAQMGGYLGYKQNRDKPIVSRIEITTNLEGSMNYFLRLQHGLQDFDYSTLRLGMSWHFINED